LACDQFQTSKEDAAFDEEYLVAEDVQFAMLEESFKEVAFYAFAILQNMSGYNCS